MPPDQVLGLLTVHVGFIIHSGRLRGAPAARRALWRSPIR